MAACSNHAGGTEASLDAAVLAEDRLTRDHERQVFRRRSVRRPAFPECNLSGLERGAPTACTDVAGSAPIAAREIAADVERVAYQPHRIRAGLELHGDGGAVLLDEQCVRPTSRDDVGQILWPGKSCCRACKLTQPDAGFPNSGCVYHTGHSLTVDSLTANQLLCRECPVAHCDSANPNCWI